MIRRQHEVAVELPAQSSPPAIPPIALEPISYDIKHAALIIGATEFFVGSAIRNGQLPAKRLGKKFVITKNALIKFVEEADPARERNLIGTLGEKI